MKLRLLAFVVISCCVLFAGGLYGYVALDSWGKQSHTLAEPKTLDFPRATPLSHLSLLLSEAGVIRQPALFQLWVRLHSNYAKFQAGTYRFENAVSPDSVADKMIRGDNYNLVAFEYTIPEGYTLKYVVEKLVANGVGSQIEFDALLHSKSFIDSLHIPASTLEGYLYPATYGFEKFPSAEEALRAPVESFWKKLPRDYEANVKAMGLTLDEAVRFASLIELETPHDDERPFVSEVIWRRLKDNAPLAIDAAIIYGIKDYQGDITSKHLKDPENLYNLRLHTGLPPTAIGSPSLLSLQAVFTPSQEGYYYYVLDANNSTRHRFAKTGEEHNRNVQDFMRENKRSRSRLSNKQ